MAEQALIERYSRMVQQGVMDADAAIEFVRYYLMGGEDPSIKMQIRQKGKEALEKLHGKTPIRSMKSWH